MASDAQSFSSKRDKRILISLPNHAKLVCCCLLDDFDLITSSCSRATDRSIVGFTLQRSSDDTKAALIPYKLGGVYDRLNWQDLASLLLEIPVRSSLPGGVVAYLRAEPRVRCLFRIPS
jgi:hypothetical protein